MELTTRVVGWRMEWQDLISNDDLKPKVEVTGAVDRLSIKIGRALSEQLGWTPGPARLQFAEHEGRSYVRLVPDIEADWQLQSAGKGGGLTLEAVQLAPSTEFPTAMCTCDSGSDGSVIVRLPAEYRIGAHEMVKRRKTAKASVPKSTTAAA